MAAESIVIALEAWTRYVNCYRTDLMPDARACLVDAIEVALRSVQQVITEQPGPLGPKPTEQ